MRFGAATLATAATPFALATTGASGDDGRRLRIGILSDIHLKEPVAAQKLERAFTAVQVPSLKYVTFETGHANHPNGNAAEQGMLLDVYDERMVIQRIDFANRKSLAPAWTIPLVGGARPFAHEARRRAAPVPEFAAGARLVAEILSGKGGETLSLDFPVVSGRDGGVRAYDYEVTVDAICFGGDARRVVRRFFSPQCHFARDAEPATMNVRIALGGFVKWKALKSKNRSALHVSVRPREVFGGLGRPLEADV